MRKLGLYNELEKTKWIVLLVVSLTIITMIFAYVFFCWAESFIRHGKQVPVFGADVFVSQNGDFIVMIEKVDPGPVSVAGCNYYLLDEHNVAVPKVQGSLKDIYCIDLNFSAGEENHRWDGNISFIDADIDGRLSPGDYFIIRSVDNGGVAETGNSLLAKYDVTADKMNQPRTFTNATVKNVDYPTSRLQTDVIDSGNISFEYENGILNRFQYIQGSDGIFNFSFSYLGEGEGNFTITIHDGVSEVPHGIKLAHAEYAYVTGEFTASIPEGTESRSQEIAFQIKDNDRNRTVYSGSCEFDVYTRVEVSPSFSPTMEWIVITIGAIGVLHWISSDHSGKGKGKN